MMTPYVQVTACEYSCRMTLVGKILCKSAPHPSYILVHKGYEPHKDVTRLRVWVIQAMDQIKFAAEKFSVPKHLAHGFSPRQQVFANTIDGVQYAVHNTSLKVSGKSSRNWAGAFMYLMSSFMNALEFHGHKGELCLFFSPELVGLFEDRTALVLKKPEPEPEEDESDDDDEEYSNNEY